MPKIRLELEVDEGLDAPLEVLAGIVESSAGIEASLLRWVRIARSKGHTWGEIGKALGVTRQSAWERFKDAEEDPDAIIMSVIGSLKPPPGAPTLEEVRREERRIDVENEARKKKKH